MRILIDADASPIKEIAVAIAKKHQLEVLLFFDTSHEYNDGYSKTIQVDKGRDTADFELVRYIRNGDLVITQDYGLASMALAKNAKVMNQNGNIYTNDNILGLLTRRQLGQKTNHRYQKGPKKRTKADDKRFSEVLETLICNI
jgi:uncharacterized protein YaiI (UPF0178 family)